MSVTLPMFGWIAAHGEPPSRWDLRRIGWELSSDAAGSYVRLVDARVAIPASGRDPSLCLFVGVDSSRERTRLLDAGCGDALPANVGLAELARRAQRVAAAGTRLPRWRTAGPLTLDLMHRDAWTGERWLSLHPREFALLWKLAERPGEPVSRARLLRDVWRLDFDPGTNSVEVHVSRLRSRMAVAGIGGLIETDPRGGYRLSHDYRAAAPSPGEALNRRLCAGPISC